MDHRRIFVTSLALFAVLAFVACRESEAEREEKAMRAAVPARLQSDGSIRLSDADIAALGLEVISVGEGDLPMVAVRFGRVVARSDEESMVVSPIAGRVTRPPDVALGALVQAGATLVAITPILTSAERVSIGVQGADIAGQIEATTRELATREAELARARDLSSSNIVSTAQLQSAETAAATTRARLGALKQSRAIQAQGQGGLILLKAPAAGTIAALNAVVGTVVKPGDLVARVIQPGPRWIDLAVPPDDDPGERYEAERSDHRWVPARLLATGTVVEDGARRDRLEVDTQDAERLMPGAAISVRVGRGAVKGIVVPDDALVPGVSADVLYVETAPKTYAPRSVVVAARFGGKSRLASGLKPGDRIVIKGAMALRGESLRSELRHQE